MGQSLQRSQFNYSDIHSYLPGHSRASHSRNRLQVHEITIHTVKQLKLHSALDRAIMAACVEPKTINKLVDVVRAERHTFFKEETVVFHVAELVVRGCLTWK